MTAPSFIRRILGLRNGVPNNADVDNNTSCNIAAALLRILEVDRVMAPSESSGIALENGVMQYLRENLKSTVPGRTWTIERKQLTTDFHQYEHLARLNALVKADQTLRSEIGLDYIIRPDVTVGIETDLTRVPSLHAAISCKWSIRSDRVQNIRHEGVILTRTRRGRQPHIVTVTAEPLPSRIAAIARGTGEVDTVYHVALEELLAATDDAGNNDQFEILVELVSQNRLADLETLPSVLAL